MAFTFPRAILFAAVAVVLAAVACSADAYKVSPVPAPTPRPTATAIPQLQSVYIPWLIVTPTPTPTAALTFASPVRGFRLPIEGACLPSSSNLLPNGPRAYRLGIHEGIDFYDGSSCVPIAKGTPVLAAKDGRVIRADLNYIEMTPEERDRLLTLSQTQGYTDAASLDRFRGRQVWVQHEGGVVTRYAHLDGVAPGIDEGVLVTAGQLIGYVGNSGTPNGIDDAGADVHLHFEIRVGDSYLGQGLSFAEMLVVLRQAFTP